MPAGPAGEEVVRNTRPRARTRMFSARVTSEGIVKVSSTPAPSVIDISAKRNSPRALTSCAYPWTMLPSIWSVSGKCNWNRCPHLRSRRTESVLIVLPFRSRFKRGEPRRTCTLSQSSNGGKLQVGDIDVLWKFDCNNNTAQSPERLQCSPGMCQGSRQ
jgi:hypothetical protein